MIFGFGRAKPALALRMAETRDATVLADIHAASFDRPWGALEIERLLADENVLAQLLASDDGKGVAVAFVLSRVAADEAEILSIAVNPARRGEGLSHQLLTSHRDVLALNGVRTLFLEVEEGNKPALALYGRQGFAEVSRRAAYYRKADGSAANAIVMRRTL
jgi:[ribosomal protein S18]-alanine N-acetyltransferase